MRIRLPSVLAAVLVALVCAGCGLSVGVDVVLQPDGSGTVTVTVVADAELVAKVPSAVSDLRLDDVKAAGWTVTGPTSGADGAVTLRLAKPFRTPAEATAILGELNGPAGPLHDLQLTLTRSFAQIDSRFTGQVHLDGGIAAFSDNALVQALGGKTPLGDLVTTPIDQVLDLTVTARLPGSVITSSGTTPPDRASTSWTPSLAQGAVTAIDAHFQQTDSEAFDARRRSHLAWIGVAAYSGLFVLVVAIAVIVVRRRHHRAAE